jgi:DNA-binding response OmpR family regulator
MNELTSQEQLMACAPMAESSLSAQEQLIVTTLCSANGRVVGRTELARVAGVPPQGRRIDVLLVNVRRVLGADRVVNVRNRGWRYVQPSTPNLEAAAS